MCLLLCIKLVKSDGSQLSHDKPNAVGCVNNLLHSMFSSLSVSLNGKNVTLHENNYHYQAYLEKLLNYGADASGIHLVSSFWIWVPLMDHFLQSKHRIQHKIKLRRW